MHKVPRSLHNCHTCLFAAQLIILMYFEHKQNYRPAGIQSCVSLNDGNRPIPTNKMMFSPRFVLATTTTTTISTPYKHFHLFIFVLFLSPRSQADNEFMLSVAVDCCVNCVSLSAAFVCSVSHDAPLPHKARQTFELKLQQQQQTKRNEFKHKRKSMMFWFFSLQLFFLSFFNFCWYFLSLSHTLFPLLSLLLLLQRPNFF